MRMLHVTGWTATAIAILLTTGRAAAEQPAPMTAQGCCCVVEGVTWHCSEKTQAECLKVQPSAPVFPKIADWKKMWDGYVAESWSQARKPSSGGWIAEKCGADIDMKTGEPGGAPTGCCCLPKGKAASDGFDCKAGWTHFDCQAECSMFADGRRPADCTWAQGACKP